MAETKEQALEQGRIRIRRHLGFGPTGNPEIDTLINQARKADCRFYEDFEKFIKARLVK